MAKRSTKSLILENDKLSELCEPFNQNFAYYVLAEKLEVALIVIFSDGDIGTSNPEKIKIYEKELPNRLADFLRHKEGEVEQTACQNLIDLLYELIGYTIRTIHPPYHGLDPAVVENLMKSHTFVDNKQNGDSHKKQITWTVISTTLRT